MSDDLYPCDGCGKGRTKEEGGKIFAYCDACWERREVERRSPRTIRIEKFELRPGPVGYIPDAQCSPPTPASRTEERRNFTQAGHYAVGHAGDWRDCKKCAPTAQPAERMSDVDVRYRLALAHLTVIATGPHGDAQGYAERALTDIANSAHTVPAQPVSPLVMEANEQLKGALLRARAEADGLRAQLQIAREALEYVIAAEVGSEHLRQLVRNALARISKGESP